MDGTELANRFSYHAVNEEQAENLEQVRENCHLTAVLINGIAPEGREKSLAMTHLEEAMFWANAAIARQPQDQVDSSS